MSVDLASIKTEPPPEAMRLSELKIDENGIFVFDFDGVVCSSDEDDIYHLTPSENEEKKLAQVADRFQINCEHMEPKYQRHLLFQACCLDLGIPIKSGIGFEKALLASKIGKFFILTARSGWFAVERLRQFLDARDMRPIEIFNVGRVAKDRQIDIVCREAGGREVYYVEDNTSHLRAVKESKLIKYDKLNYVWAEREAPAANEELRKFVNQVFDRSIRS